MNDLISVIIPIYGVEEWLEECIMSVVSQSYTNLEIILVDDGSPDNCPLICDEWKKKDSRIKVIHKTNGGLSSARNAGLNICRGNYISFIDSDDFIHKDMYRIMLDDMNSKDVDIVRCAMNRYDGSEYIDNRNIRKEKYYNTDEILDCYFYHKEDVCGGVCDKLFKAELYKDVRFPEGINSEDYYMNLRIYRQAKSMYYNNIPLYYYRLRDNSISRMKKIDAHSYDKIVISDMVKEYVTKYMPERKKDTEVFGAMIRFAIYYKLINEQHEKQLERNWQSDLKKYINTICSSRKMTVSYKIKYLVFTYCPQGYIFIKKMINKH